MLEVHDTETLINCFIYCGIDVVSKNIVVFELSERKNNLYTLLNHIKGKTLIGYNNLHFDSQILEYIINEYDQWFDLRGDEIALKIYAKAQEIIHSNRQFPAIPEWWLSNKHIDLFKLWHFDNKARGTGLKDLQIMMRWKKVQDMPIPHNKPVKRDQIDEVIDYCKNDILSTFEFYKRSRKQLELREQLGKKFNLNLINAGDPKIGSEIFAKLISERTGIDRKVIKAGRTYRKSIQLKTVILNTVNYKNPILNAVLDRVKRTTISGTKGEFEHKFKYGGVPFELKLGGIHACCKPGVYEAKKGKKILDIDVTSFYPWLAIANRWYPEHLGEIFCDICKELFDERAKIPKSDPVNYAYKIMLNGVYGKSNENTSFFYDPRYTMQITVNGQLIILMLAERLVSSGFNILQANTDGITIMYDEGDEELVYTQCKLWMMDTGLTLEYASYSKMVIRDVNNYMAIDTKGKVKYKGAFEILDSATDDFKEWHKEPSFTIVSRAISNYFIHDIAVESTINSCDDILEFIGRAKFKSDSIGEIRGYVNVNDELLEYNERQQKTTRYYVSNIGNRLVKVYDNGNESGVNSGYLVTIYNNHVPRNIDSYNINKKFYIEQAYKIISKVEGNKSQLSLF